MKRPLITSAALALFAILIVSGSIVSTASAETLLAEWLLNGNPVTGTKAIEVSGEVLLEDTKMPIVGKIAIKCSGILDGWVDADGLALISEELTLSGVKVEENLVGTGLLCATESGCEAATEASPIEDWPIGFPTPGLLFLKDGAFSLLAENAGSIIGGSEVLCLVLGAMVEDTCSGTRGEGLIQNGTAPNGAEIPAKEAASPLGTCTEGGAESGAVETVTAAKIILVGGGELTVSSESVVR